MKVVALKDLNLGGIGIVAVTKNKGDVFELPDEQPVGGKILFYNEFGTGKKLPLVLGIDISVVEEPLPPDKKVLVTDQGKTKDKVGSYMFVGAIVVLSYIAYKVIVKK